MATAKFGAGTDLRCIPCLLGSNSEPVIIYLAMAKNKTRTTKTPFMAPTLAAALEDNKDVKVRVEGVASDLASAGVVLETRIAGGNPELAAQVALNEAVAEYGANSEEAFAATDMLNETRDALGELEASWHEATLPCSVGTRVGGECASPRDYMPLVLILRFLFSLLSLGYFQLQLAGVLLGVAIKHRILISDGHLSRQRRRQTFVGLSEILSVEFV